MPTYQASIIIPLSIDKAAWTLQGQFVDPATDDDVGDPVTTGFSNRGGGFHRWYGTVPQTGLLDFEIFREGVLTAPVAIMPMPATIDNYLGALHGTGVWGTTAPSSADVCKVEGYLYDGSGNPAANKVIKASLLNPPQQTGDGVLTTEYIKAATGPDGYFFLNMAREKLYRLEVLEAGINQIITVPNSASVDWRTLLTS
jgi:hypothetical protein